MRFSTMAWGLRVAVAGGAAAGLAVGTGCSGVLGVQPPTAELNRVDLVQSPSAEDMALYACDGYCGAAPRKQDLLFSFDLVFDLENPNLDLPIPLVELLLGLNVLDDTNLGAVCISFCDPDSADCVPGVNAEGACDAGDARNVDEPADLVPTIDDMVGLAESAASGSIDNTDWKTIPPGEGMEAHIQFDLGVDPMLDITEDLLGQAAEDFLHGDNVSFDIPYIVEGSLFFDAPELGRYALGFGPFEDTWELQ
jgi:hypothetical protein